MVRFAALLLLSGSFAHAASAPAGRAESPGCHLPADQGAGSLLGAWKRLPVHLVFDQDFYVADQGRDLAPLKRAVATWNTWAAARHREAFVIDNDRAGVNGGRMIPNLFDCDQAYFTGAVREAVGVWKIARSGAHANRRPSCGTRADGSPGRLLAPGVPGQTDWVLDEGKILGASVLLNFDDYNRPGRAEIDVESVFLHELGHVLGLLNSCNGSGNGTVDSTTAPACFKDGALAVPPAYANAVMFPFLAVNQFRRSPGQNDLERVNCLY